MAASTTCLTGEGGGFQEVWQSSPILDALVALYASAAIIVNTTWDRTVLPVP